jgi:hypothetical protein
VLLRLEPRLHPLAEGLHLILLRLKPVAQPLQLGDLPPHGAQVGLGRGQGGAGGSDFCLGLLSGGH